MQGADARRVAKDRQVAVRLDAPRNLASLTFRAFGLCCLVQRSGVLMKIRSAAVVVFSLSSVFSCGTAALAQTIPPAVKTAEASINGENIRAHVKFLSDDLLEGRGPGLRGSELAAKYIATEFALYGLKPGGDDGTYMQEINFVGMKVVPGQTSFSLVPKKPAGEMSIDLYSIDLKYGD